MIEKPRNGETTSEQRSEERELWMAWSDQDDGWIAAIHGSSDDRDIIEARIARETEEYSNINRFGLRPVRVTVHL